MLNASSPVPLYRQLADELWTSIRTDAYEPGQRIPSEQLLASRYGIGRPTVRQATELLVRRGVLERRRGAGTFVRRPAESVDLFSLAGTLEAFRKSGLEPETVMVEPLTLEPAADDVRAALGDGPVYRFARLSSLDGEPLLLEELQLRAAVFPKLEDFDLANRSLSALLEDHYYLRPEGGRQSFRVGALPEERAKLLAVEGCTPLLLVERVLDFPGAKKALLARMACRTDRVVFSQSLTGVSHA